MAHIKEPEGVDFIIQSEPLTDQARHEISSFINTYKTAKTVRRTVRQASAPKEKNATNV